MKHAMIAAAVFVLAPAALPAQSKPQTASLAKPVSSHELHDRIRTADGAAQYKNLADYFHQQEASCRAEATAEKSELDRRAEVNAALYQKYPRPADTARGIYDFYVASADSAALQAEHFDQLAAGEERKHDQMAGEAQGHS